MRQQRGNLYVLFAALLAGVGMIYLIASAVSSWGDRREAAGYQAAAAKCQQRIDAGLAKQRQREADLQSTFERALHESEQRAADLAADNAALRAGHDRLRATVSDLRGRLATASAEAARHAADACLVVFEECAGRYGAVAADADRCLADRETLIDAWPTGVKTP